MRIDAYNAINQIQATSKLNKMNATQKSTAADKVEISQAGREFQIAKKAVAESPDIRIDLVNDIKGRIGDGTYNVTDDDFADKMIQKIFG